MSIEKQLKNMGFAIHLENEIIYSKNVELKQSLENNKIIFTGTWNEISIEWIFISCPLGFLETVELDSSKPIGCKQIDFFYTVKYTDDMLNWIIPMFGNRTTDSGVKFVSDLNHRGNTCRATGLFEDLSQKGLMLAEVIPLKFIFNCRAARKDDTLLFSTETIYTPACSQSTHVSSQLTWFCNNCTPREGMDFLKNMLPKSTLSKPKVVGWNSWDYYFTTISHEDIMENVNFIAQDKVLRKEIKYIAIDDGWQHNQGEWEANYKFAKGMKYTAEEITKKGFIPGIWTAPIDAAPLSFPALRMSEMLIKDQYGDPLKNTDQCFLIDPTHPMGIRFLHNIFKKLYNDGFRLFKVDFVSSLLKAENFYDKTVGPYDAIVKLFKIIREAVTFDSIIIGCSLPAECGADIADTARISVDIHNCWTHVEWVIDALQYNYQYHNTLWKNDLDFMVVRGSDTSEEKENNVLNPKRNYQALQKTTSNFDIRWRNGEDFNYYEAQTWASFVALSGGNILLSDRLSKLNEKGISLIKRALAYKKDDTVSPTFLKGDIRATLWTSDDTVMVVNWNDYEETKAIPIDLDKFDLRSEKEFTYKNKELTVTLKPHESIVLELS